MFAKCLFRVKSEMQLACGANASLGLFVIYDCYFVIYRISPLPGGLWPPSSSSGWAAFQASALSISGGMGGAVGMWEPCTWKPFSSAIHVMLTCWPSGATYASEPCETTGVSCSTCFGCPDSWWLIPLLVSKLRDRRPRDTAVTASEAF